MKTNKTLADAQPGGRVRLGDQAERARFEAWAEERELGTAKCSADGMKGDYADLNTDWCWAAWQAALSAQPSPGGRRFHQVSQVAKHFGLAVTPEEMGEAIANAPSSRFSAESAAAAFANVQPSPGGQDALDCIGRIEEAIEFRVPHDIYAAVHGELAELKAALAARQPVAAAVKDSLTVGGGQAVGQEPAMYQVRPRSFDDGEGWRQVTKRQFDDRGEFPGYPDADWERRTLYAAPPAQAVDLGMQLDRYDAGLLGDGGGGDVGWWQDYIRTELDRAHEFYQDQADAHG